MMKFMSRRNRTAKPDIMLNARQSIRRNSLPVPQESAGIKVPEARPPRSVTEPEPGTRPGPGVHDYPAETAANTRGLWLAVSILAAVMVGATAGSLAWAGGLNIPQAILAGGSAFGGALLLLLAILTYLASGRYNG